MNVGGHSEFVLLALPIYLVAVAFAIWVFYLMYLLTRALRKYLRS